jgi:predicted ABC-type sugar transport system permease subunit
MIVYGMVCSGQTSITKSKPSHKAGRRGGSSVAASPSPFRTATTSRALLARARHLRLGAIAPLPRRCDFASALAFGRAMKSAVLPSQRFSQERIVFAITVVLFLIFSATLDRFLTSANLLSLLQSVSVLGILGVGMAIVVIGRGIDLSIVAVMAIPVAWLLTMMDHGVAAPLAFALGLGFALAIGALNGIFIAYVEAPALFATLAIGAFVYGFGRSQLFSQDIIALPKSESWIAAVGRNLG